ncbi:MAG: translation initiation factor IF-3 [Sphingobacteriia bacterium]|nr:translation initiation factor IF-3 [Sphingobacteriia bacterium]
MALVNQNRNNRGRKEEPYRINGRILASEVRIVGMEDEASNGVFSLDEALRLAEQAGLDLVEIAPNAVPPVCRITEYTKFKYEQKKRDKENKSKQHVVVVKEIRFGPNTDEHDFNFKVKHAQKFLKDGNKVKAYVHFYGRTIVYKERGEKLLLEFAVALEELAKVEMLPKLEGKRMYILLTPTAKATAAAKSAAESKS